MIDEAFMRDVMESSSLESLLRRGETEIERGIQYKREIAAILGRGAGAERVAVAEEIARLEEGIARLEAELRRRRGE